MEVGNVKNEAIPVDVVQKKIGREIMFWRYIRRIRWDIVYYPLLNYIRDNLLPANLSSKMKQRVVALADLVQYDSTNEQLILETDIQQPEYVSNNGIQVFKSKMQRYIIASPADVDSIIEMVYKAPSLGGFRGVTLIYKK